MLTPPATFGTSHGVLDLNSSSLVETRKTVENSILYAPNGRLNCLLAWSTINSQLHGGPQLLHTVVGTQLPWFFQNLPNSHPISSGHDVIHTPAPFPVWGLLWQWWWSYPLRPSVNCTQRLCTWTKSWIVQSPTKLNDKI